MNEDNEVKALNAEKDRINKEIEILEK